MSDKTTERTMDEVLRRMLSTPPDPHKPPAKEKKPKEKKKPA